MNRFITKLRLLASAAVIATAFAACTTDQSPLTVKVNEPSTLYEARQQVRKKAHKRNAVKYKDRGVKHGKGCDGAATLQVRALVAKDGSTLVEATTGDLEAGTKVGNIDKTQVKVLGSKGPTKNFNNLKAGGYWSTTLTPGVTPGTKIQVQAQVSGVEGRRTNVVTAVATAARRPDLAVEAVNGPAEGLPGMPVTITALVTERNGDVGARANCVLAVNGVAVDQATGIWVDAGGAVSCLFTHTFAGEGTYALSVSASGVNPGDWDLANNTRASSITIAAPEPADFGAGTVQAVSIDYEETRTVASLSGPAYSRTEKTRQAYNYVQLQGNQFGEEAPVVDVVSIDATVRVNGAVVHDITLEPNNGYAFESGGFSVICRRYDGETVNDFKGDTVVYVQSGDLAEFCVYETGGDPATRQTTYTYQKVQGEVLYYSAESYESAFGETNAYTWVEVQQYASGVKWNSPLGSTIRLSLSFNGVGGAQYAFDRTVTLDTDLSDDVNTSYESEYDDPFLGARIRETETRAGSYLMGFGSW